MVTDPKVPFVCNRAQARVRSDVPDGPHYDDHEVGLILKRVVEIHEREGKKIDSRRLSKGEIEQVVGELGLPTALVTRALAELAVPNSRNRSVWWLGGKIDLMVEETIDRRIDETTYSRMVEILRRHLGDPGDVKVEGGAHIWSTSRQTRRRVHFTVVESGETTTLRLEERMQGDARATVGTSTSMAGFFGFMTIVPLTVFVAKSVLLLAMGPLAAVGATVGWLAGRTVWKQRSTEREIQLRRAFAEILASARAEPRALLPGASTD